MQRTTDGAHEDSTPEGPSTTGRSGPGLLLGVLLVAAIAGAAYLSRSDAGLLQQGVQTADAGDHGFQLAEVSEEIGVEFDHLSPRFDARLDPIMPLIASMGAGVAVADFDRDGWSDFYVTNSRIGTRSHLYRNLGDGRFDEVGRAMGVAEVNSRESGVATGALWGDFDNDGYEDLFVNKWGRPELFRNMEGRGFEPVTEDVGLPTWINATSAVWLDYDRDGWLDLFIGGYYPDQLDLWALDDTRIMPESFEYAQNGGQKHLFRNVEGARFEDVAEEAGIRSSRWSLAAAAADLRGSGYPDLVIANDYGVPEYYLNQGDGTFREAGADLGIAERPESGMNVSFGDVFNDGRRAIYISNISEKGILVQGNNLWVPSTTDDGAAARYHNLAQATGVELGGWSWGAQFGDLNNDGHQDLVLTNGFVSADRKANYWYDYSKVTGANTSIISDADNWPPMDDMSLAGYQQKKVWINDGAGQFTDVAQVVGFDETYDGRAVALADLWNRGVLDVLVAHQDGPLLVYRNAVDPDRNWIGFGFEAGEHGASPFGVQVEVQWAGQRQVQDLVSASGFCAQNHRRLHFGLGEAEAVDRVRVRWPSGEVQVLEDLDINRLHRLRPPSRASASGYAP